MTTQLKLKICIPDGIISDFCYPFLKALLDKLKELEKEDRIFEDGVKIASSARCSCDLTNLAKVITNKIMSQIDLYLISEMATPLEIKGLIDLTEEFLTTFEVK